MDHGSNAHDPSNWQINALFAWLSFKVADVSSRIKQSKGTPLNNSDLIVSILQTAKDHPELCVPGHAALLDRVVRKHSQKRVVPTAVVEDVVANPIYTTGKEIEADEDDDTESDLSLNFETFDPLLEKGYGFGPELAYRQLQKDVRLIRHNFRLHGVHISNIDKLVTVGVASVEEEDLMPQDDNLSELSSNFWKEIEEEDEQASQPIATNLDYLRIVKDEIDQFRQLWILRKLSKCQQKIGKLWSSYHNHHQRTSAANIKLSAAKHLEQRLEKLKATIIDHATGTSEKALRKQCACLEQTVFDHQKFMFEYSALKSLQPPSPVGDRIRRIDRPVKMVSHDDDSDPDAISLDSGSASIMGVADQQPNEIPDISHDVKRTNIGKDMFINTDEEFLDDIRTMSVESSSGSKSVPMSLDDVVESDTSTAETNNGAAHAAVLSACHDVMANEQLTSSGNILGDQPDGRDLEKEPATVIDLNEDNDDDLESLVDLTPAGKKRRKMFKQSQESKRHQSDAMKRAHDDESRAIQNSQTLLTTKTLIINPGKKDGEQYVYINEAIGRYLKPHQIDGVRFLWREILLESDDSKATGCLLSHTMGLGKTMQVITLLLTIAETAMPARLIAYMIPHSLRRSTTLILCPPGLVSNWLMEFRKWLPSGTEYLLCQVHTINSMSTSHDALRAWAEHGGVLVVGYSMFASIVRSSNIDATQQKTAQLLLNTATLVVADEAHYIKNSDTNLRKAADQLSTKRRIAMTGSPLSNNIREYWSMIDWVSPGYLGPAKEFRAMFEIPIQEGSYMESSKLEEKAARVALTTLERVLQPKVHRRDATVLKDMLPPKREFIIKMSLTSTQQQLYSQYVELLQHGSNRKFRIGEVLNHGKSLIWIANHPAIFSRHIAARQIQNGPTQRPMTEDLTQLEQVDIRRLALQFNDEDLSLSPKTICFLEIVRAAMAEDDKTLLFSQSLRTLDYLADQLAAHGICYDRLTGDTDMHNRGELLSSFNAATGPSSKWVLLISTRTGNAGFNIHGANRVVIFDFDWNPTYEEQAIGRAYRLGQRKNVFVYRFVSEGTFESVLLNTTAGKTQLSVQVVEGKRTQNMISKDASKYISVPVPAFSMGPEVLAQWIGHDSVLDSVLHLNIRSANPFITELIDAEVFRKERQPEPLDDKQTRDIEEWVARVQRGDWSGPTTSQSIMLRTQMQELSARYQGQALLSSLTPTLGLPIIAARQQPSGAVEHLRNSSQIRRSGSHNSSASENERQDVRLVSYFNNHASTQHANPMRTTALGVNGVIGTSSIPTGVEVIDLTEETVEEATNPGSRGSPKMASLSDHGAGMTQRAPAQRAAQALQRSRWDVAPIRNPTLFSQGGLDDTSIATPFRITPYVATSLSNDHARDAPTWSNRSRLEAAQPVNTSAPEEVEGTTAFAPDSIPASQKRHVVGQEFHPHRKEYLPAMSQAGKPQLTTPSRYRRIAPKPTSADAKSTMHSAPEESPVAPDGLASFREQMYPGLSRRQTQS